MIGFPQSPPEATPSSDPNSRSASAAIVAWPAGGRKGPFIREAGGELKGLPQMRDVQRLLNDHYRIERGIGQDDIAFKGVTENSLEVTVQGIQTEVVRS